MAAWIAKQWEALKGKGARYWAVALFVIGLGIWVGDKLAESCLWRDQRQKCYLWLNDRIPRKPHPQRTALVLIEDDEYWLGELAGRRPIHRDYLARLLSEVAKADAAVIALDFDLRSPSPKGTPREQPAYSAEADKLFNAVRDVATSRPVVLPKTIANSPNGYITESDIYDDYDFGNGQVLKGYISLPYDPRGVPILTMQLQGGDRVDSMAQAIVRADNKRLLPENNRTTLPYGSFMALESFPRVSAREVLQGNSAALAELKHKIVIIGAHWHQRAFERGGLIDLNDSPLGLLPGVVLHANYVEAIIDSRLYWAWSPTMLYIVDGLGAGLVALIFALKINPIVKVLAVLGIGLLLVGISISSLLLFGLVFDFFIPVVSVIAHGVIERALE
jgi:CHASE2 domain-containing sensor protein